MIVCDCVTTPIWSVSEAFLHQRGPRGCGGRSPAGLLVLGPWDYVTKL